jgi:tetratricopeptide (TPR) repeat protein
MLQLTLRNAQVSVDPHNLPLNSEFDKLFNLLSQNNTPPENLEELAYLYRNHIKHAESLLDLANSTADYIADPKFYEKQIISIKISRLGLFLHHNKDPHELFENLKFIQDKRIDFLKAFYFYNRGEIEDALFLFNKISYKFGIELCYIKLNKKEELLKSSDIRMKCYGSSKEWLILKERIAKSNEDKQYVESLNKNFLFRIGLSNEYLDPENLDVQLSILSANLNKLNMEEIENKLSEFVAQNIQNSEIFYLLGKIHHLKNNTFEASKFYNLSLDKEKGYVPAEYNLKRIQGTLMAAAYPSVADYNALVNIKNSNFDIDLNLCSEQIRKVCLLIIHARNRQDFSSQIKGLEHLFDREVIANNMAIICKDKENAIKILEESVIDCNKKYEEALKYNLGIIKEDTSILNELFFPESMLNVHYLEYKHSNGSVLNLESPIRGYLEKNIGILREKKTLISDLFVASILIEHDKIEEAIEIYKNNSGSFYSINGLGVCYALMGNITCAIKMFRQVQHECADALINLANCYVLKSNIKEAAECLLQYIKGNSITMQADNMLRTICYLEKDLKLINKCILKNVSGLEDLKALILIENGDIEEARMMNSKDSKVIELLKSKEDIEEKRKRKMKEIEEFRKKRN